MENNELYHWGIKGMKWGVRRYQNSDGTYTEEGKRRYNKTEDGNNKKNEKIKNMSDEELARRIKRLQNEAEYIRLKKQTEPGKAFVEDVLSQVGKKVLVSASAGAILYGLQTVLGNKFDLGGLGKAVFYGGPKKGK